MSHPSDSGPGPDGGPGAFLDDDVPVVVGAVLETLPGRAPSVACRLGDVEGLDVVGGDGDRRLAVVCCASSARALERTVQRLIRADEEILGFFPTFMGQDDGGEGAGSEARDGALRQLASEGEEETEP